MTGQDGSYLAKLLLKKGYVVHGVKRRASSLNTLRIDDIYVDPHIKNNNFYLHYGDLTDSLSVLKNIQSLKPDEIYNLGAQSHVGVSFEVPRIYSKRRCYWNLRILDLIKTLKLEKKQSFIRQELPKCLVPQNHLKVKKHHFIPESLCGSKVICSLGYNKL